MGFYRGYIGLMYGLYRGLRVLVLRLRVGDLGFRRTVAV